MLARAGEASAKGVKVSPTSGEASAKSSKALAKVRDVSATSLKAIAGGRERVVEVGKTSPRVGEVAGDVGEGGGGRR